MHSRQIETGLQLPTWGRDFPFHNEQYQEDGRWTIEELRSAYDTLLEHGWSRELVYMEKRILPNGKTIELPIYAYYSPNIVDGDEITLLLSGTHGEEPAPNIAIALEIKTIIQYAKNGIPFVFIPLLNPWGYMQNRRYPNGPRSFYDGSSVTDPDNFLLSLDPEEPNQPRLSYSTSVMSDKICRYLLETKRRYRIKLGVEVHEDELKGEDEDPLEPHPNEGYMYYSGSEKYYYLAKKVVNILLHGGAKLVSKESFTRFHEKVVDSIVWNPNDGSVQELMAATKVYIDGIIYEMFGSTVYIVPETTFDHSWPAPKETLSDRIEVMRKVIRAIKEIWDEIEPRG